MPQSSHICLGIDWEKVKAIAFAAGDVFIVTFAKDNETIGRVTALEKALGV